MTKRGSSFEYESSHLREELVFGIIVLERVLFFLRDVVRILCIFSFLSLLDTLFLYMRSCDHL